MSPVEFHRLRLLPDNFPADQVRTAGTFSEEYERIMQAVRDRFEGVDWKAIADGEVL